MPRPNDYNAPTCPICCASMRKAGTVKTQVKVIDGNTTTFIPKQRWRCSKCNYSETANSVASNSNHRTGYGIEKLSKLIEFGVLNKPLIQRTTNRVPRETQAQTSLL